jgi:Domain of unknown function (DUF4357)
MKFGKTIKIFLIDGDPNGRMSCELSNWTGKAYKIPRIKVKECGDRADLGNTGVYLLFGRNEEGLDQVYIGEAEEILKRLNQHLIQKDFWHEAIVFVSKDDNLNKAHIKYLENRLYSIAKATNRYASLNLNTPTQSAISESDRAEMEEFIENIKLLVNTLGHKVFEQKRETSTASKAPDNVFALKGPRGADALGMPNSEGFVVFKGSKCALTTVNSLQPSFAKYRQKLLEAGTLKEGEESYTLLDDLVVSSPSTAAAIVLGRNANGLTEWKLPSGTTLKEHELATSIPVAAADPSLN